jgi:hypothetical protein
LSIVDCRLSIDGSPDCRLTVPVSGRRDLNPSNR